MQGFLAAGAAAGRRARGRGYSLVGVAGTGGAPASNAARVRFRSRISLISPAISGPVGLIRPASTFF